MNVIDKHTGKVDRILKKTTNSYLVTRTKLTENGISCSNWFTIRDFNDNFFTLKTYAEHVISKLDKCKNSDFASTYIHHRMHSFDVFHKGLILSISHGIGYFDNILKYQDDPEKWLDWGDKDRKKVIYEKNFVTLINNNRI